MLRGVHGHLFAPAALAAWIAELYTKTWILHAEPVNLGHERERTHAEAAEQTLGHLAQYANGVALSHQRLLVIEDDNVVLFSHIDRRDDGRRKTTRVLGVEFLDRFLLKCEHFEHVWCQAQDILPRFGAVGQHGSIAVVERFHRTLKELLRLTTIPEDQTAFERELGLIIDWYNEHRPYETLDGKTPNEVHYVRPAAHERPRFEPRTRWPRGSPCAAPQVGVDGDPGDPILFEIDCLDDRRHLPLIRVRRAA